jgi:hypothetical protein
LQSIRLGDKAGAKTTLRRFWAGHTPNGSYKHHPVSDYFCLRETDHLASQEVTI